MDFLGQGIAIAGIWIGVGLVGLKRSGSIAFVAFFAMLATIAIAS